jgi:N6-L-threonylcarbamoyladenine synthase
MSSLLSSAFAPTTADDPQQPEQHAVVAAATAGNTKGEECGKGEEGAPQSNLLSPRDKRRRRLGLAKAVDRGQVGIVSYRPGGPSGRDFQALSGLPDAISNNKKERFVVLGIESSCDDTGAAVVSSDGTILGEALASQSAVHEPFGGVVPGLARDEHERSIDRVIEEALRRAGMESPAEVDAIGVTVGPGLEICLRIGCNKAVELAQQYNKPFVGVHHLEAHILMVRLFSMVGRQEDDEKVAVSSSAAAAVVVGGPQHVEDTEGASPPRRIIRHSSLDFPFLALLVSGGHCLLLRCLGIGNYQILGGTIDDSLGEAFDKVARLLGLPVGGGGGPRVEALARDGGGDPSRFPFTVPLQARKRDLDFSYSGLKTNVRRVGEQLARELGVEAMHLLPNSDKADLAASFQNVAIKHIEQRLERAMKLMEEESVKKLAVVGGVAANRELRRRLDRLCAERGWEMAVPPPRFCTDQGAMSAWAAVERLMVKSSDDPASQQVHARYPFASTPSPFANGSPVTASASSLP